MGQPSVRMKPLISVLAVAYSNFRPKGEGEVLIGRRVLNRGGAYHSLVLIQL